MRFKKGSQVEVLIRNEVPTGAWRCAVIISGNDHTYTVRYGWFPATGEAGTVRRVPMEAIRPCPPPTNGTDDWVPGDVVEVFDDLYWKPALIVRVFDGNNFLVRILGSNREFKAHQSWLRVRQAWEHGNWFLVGKSSSNSPAPKRKRSSLGFSDVGGQKKRATEKGSVNGKRILVRLSSPASKKVPLHRIDDTVSRTSSFGSCSGLGNNVLNLSPTYVAKGCENSEDYCSDAESYFGRRCEEEGSSGCRNVGSVMDCRRSELRAYPHALEALYTSGSLTREEEAKVTDLCLFS